MKTSKRIPDKLYKQIVELVPILCVDVILVYKKKYILVKRENEPLKGMWFLIGGRALKGETFRQAVNRKVKEECGLSISNLKPVGFYNDRYPKGAQGVPTHTASVVFRADVKNFKPKLCSQSSEIKLSDTLPPRFLKHYEKV